MIDQFGQIEQLNLTVDRLRDELAEAREDLQQEKQKTESTMEREKYWETEFQNQIKEIDTLRSAECWADFSADYEKSVRK